MTSAASTVPSDVRVRPGRGGAGLGRATAATGTAGTAREATLVGALGVVLGVLGSWVPSFWTDEVATIRAAGRTWPEVWALLGGVDAVHGLYYGLMHLWIQAFGASPFSVRLPSAIACGLAAAGVYVLGRRLAGSAAGRFAALVFLVLPGVAWMAADARSGGFVTATTVWCAVLLLDAIERGRWRWIGYAVLLTLSILLFVQTAVLVLAHAITVAWVRPGWRVARWWAVAVAVPGVALVPFALVTLSQRAQVDWIGPVDLSTIRSVLLLQWFQDAWLVGAIVLLLAAAAVVLPRWAGAAWDPRPVSLGQLAVPWLLVPTIAVLGVSLVVAPLYVPRYLTYTAPALALLTGVALASFGRRWVSVGLAIVLVAVVTPTQVRERGEFAKDGTDWSAAAREVEGFLAEGDAVVFVPDGGEGRSPRRALDGYPGAFEAADDVGLGTWGVDADALWDDGVPLETVLEDESLDRVVLVGAHSRFPAELEATLKAFADRGFDARVVWKGPATTVLELTAG